MANEWKKMLIHYWIFLFLFFFWIQLVPGLKTSIYVHDSEDFFLMSTFFLINCWKTSWQKKKNCIRSKERLKMNKLSSQPKKLEKEQNYFQLCDE